MKWTIAFFVGLLVLSYTPLSLAVIKVDPSTTLLVDENNRVRFFHGVNVVYKEPPWYPPIIDTFDPILSLNQFDIDNLAKWGFNFVRLGVMWPGVFPEKGYLNTTYLDTINEIITNLGNAGIYTLIDAHQDVFSRYYCGEGVPDWLVKEQKAPLARFPLPTINASVPIDNSTNYPTLEFCLARDFASYYPTDAVSQLFEEFYTPSTSIYQSFQEYWNVVSSYFANNSMVIGYELINEPWPGDIYTDPLLLIEPGYADKKNLVPLYTALNSVVRKNDDEHIIFFEKLTTDVLGARGMTSGPGGEEYNDRQVFSYHIYCAPTTRGGDPEHIYECDAENWIMYQVDIEDLARLGTGGFMTEFGATGNVTYSIEMLEYLTQQSDIFLQSWAYWQFKYYNDITTGGSAEGFYDLDGNLEYNKVKALSRSYPQAVAGLPFDFSFNAANSDFWLSYSIDPSISLPTEIYINEEFYYPQGFNVLISPQGTATWKSSSNLVSVYAVSTVMPGTVVNVTITAVN
eukprot:TRINITY_DN712_c0_g1_i4.p1 TRINITY_DN712_c0_g1~~TRINITY_DN712_c0_g1_i4.p1  ORF type:complete len:514 (+),score=101.67 TRINITY_DN712_c0_g1_i4:1010-2551(+)